MKTLILMRHGAADNNHDDKARRLTPRGRDEVVKTAAFLKEKQWHYDLVLASNATRTSETADIICQKADSLVKDERLYLASHRELSTIISQQPDTIDGLLVIGHNPGLQELAQRLVPGAFVGFSTAAAAVININSTCWHDLMVSDNQLLEVSYAPNDCIIAAAP